MADEQQASAFNIDMLNVGMNENTGELELTIAEPKIGEETSTQETTQQQQTQQPVDQTQQLFSGMQQQIYQLSDLVQKQSNALGLLLKNNIQQIQPEPESLGEDNDKLVNTIHQKVSGDIKKLEEQVTPFIQQQQLAADTMNEWQQFCSQVPDAIDYSPGMQLILTKMPNHPWTFGELYVLAKGMNLKVQTNNQQVSKPSNVQNINERRLPERQSSTNATLKSKEIRAGKEGLKDAMEAALEEIGFNFGT